MTKIDFVVPWVDDSDPVWRAKKESLFPQKSSARHKDYGTFKYWFRMVEENAPWVNKIYIVTDGQKPEWLNVDNPKIELVYHEDFIPKEYLPTFNSGVIIMNTHRIKGLSENYVLFNDDTFLVNRIEPTDYFVNGKPKLYGIYSPIVPDEMFKKTLFNNMLIINKHFPDKALKRYPFKFFNFAYGVQNIRNLLTIFWKKPGYINMHLPSPLTKSTLEHLWKIENEFLDRASQNKVRHYDTESNEYLVNYWNIETGNFEPARVDFGKNILINDLSKLEKMMKNRRNKIICVNDIEGTNDEQYELLENILSKHFPKKSSFEK